MLHLLPWLAIAILLSGCSLHKQQLQPYAGQWVLQQDGKNLAVLNTQVQHGRLMGTLEVPQHFTESGDGRFTDVGTPVQRKPLRSLSSKEPVVLAIGKPGNIDNAPRAIGRGSQHLSGAFPNSFRA